jgi:hypothetical protein
MAKVHEGGIIIIIVVIVDRCVASSLLPVPAEQSLSEIQTQKKGRRMKMMRPFEAPSDGHYKPPPPPPILVSPTSARQLR